MNVDIKDAIDAVDRLNSVVLDWKTRHEDRLNAVQATVERLAAYAAGTSHAAPSPAGALRLPSLRELESRAMSIGTDPQGGYIVPELTGPFFDRLRPQNVVMAAGPLVVDMEGYDLKLPRLVTSATVRTPGEGGTITESDLTLAAGTMPAKKYAVRTIASSELLADSNPASRGLIANDHVRQLANRLDFDMLEGAAGPIIGLRNTPTATTTELGAGSGTTPTLANIIDMLYRLEAANADLSRVAIFMAPRTWNTLQKIVDGQSRFQLQPDPTTDSARRLFGQPVFTSSQISITETVGGSTDCSYIVAADMSRVVVGRRLEVAVLYDPYSRSSTDQVVVQTITRWAFAAVDPDAVEVLTGVRP